MFFYLLTQVLEDNKSLFRKFEIKPPFKSVKDIFCIRINRIADAYRKISLNNVPFRVNNVNPRDNVNLRIYPLNNGLSEIRFWSHGELVDIQKIKNTDLKGVHF